MKDLEKTVAQPIEESANNETAKKSNENQITRKFVETQKTKLLMVYDALKERGYDPYSQLLGYIITEDPAYVTAHRNARSIISKIDRDALIRDMIAEYLGKTEDIKDSNSGKE